jgi:ribonuclease D
MPPTDVIWLHPLKAVLEAEAAERNLLEFVGEEQELLSTTIPHGSGQNRFPEAADLYALSPREQYLASELLRYRDELARRIEPAGFTRS